MVVGSSVSRSMASRLFQYYGSILVNKSINPMDTSIESIDLLIESIDNID